MPQSNLSNSGHLRALLAPSSIAILGASERIGSIGAILAQSLNTMGFKGAIWPVNPNYESLYGKRCYRSLHDLPAPPDMTAVCVKGSVAVNEIRNLIGIGGRSAVIYDGGFAEAGPAGEALQRELIESCQSAGLALCGPNCMGSVNLIDRVSSYKLPIVAPDTLRGNVGLISQIGRASCRERVL